MTTRRGFLAAALAACAAPAYVKAGILMPVKQVWAPALMGMDFGTDGGLVIFRNDGMWIAGAHGGDVYFSGPVQPYAFPAQWTPDEIAAIRSRPEPPLVFNQISVTDWPKVAAAQDEKNRRLTRVLAGLA